eukprot:7006449-Pyramimonas_sp.AAC.1
MEFHRRPEWRSSHASPPPRTTFSGPIGSSTEVPLAQFACVSPAQDSASWPHRELHRGPSGAVRMRPPLSRTVFHGPIGSPTEGPSGAVRMRLPHPGQRF